MFCGICGKAAPAIHAPEYKKQFSQEGRKSFGHENRFVFEILVRPVNAGICTRCVKSIFASIERSKALYTENILTESEGGGG